MRKLWLSKGNFYFPVSQTTTRKVFRAFQKDTSRPPTPDEVVDWYNTCSKDYAPGGNEGHDYIEYFRSFGLVYHEEKIPISDSPKGEALPGGLYNQVETNDGDALSPITVSSRSGIRLGNVQDMAEKDLAYFLDNKKEWDAIGAAYKRGYLFYGPPGNGKTNLVNLTVKRLVANNPDAVVLYITDKAPFRSLTENLKIEEERLKIFVVEEITEIAKHFMNDLLTFLDGDGSVPNSITFATTNYAGDLPTNLIERPGRFDQLFRVGDPEDNIRRDLLRFLGEDDGPEMVSLMKGLSMAAIHEVVRSAKIFNVPIQEEVGNFRKRVETAKNDFGESKRERAGFSTEDAKEPRGR